MPVTIIKGRQMAITYKKFYLLRWARRTKIVAADRKKERDAKKSDIMKSPASIGFPSPAEKYYGYTRG